MFQSWGDVCAYGEGVKQDYTKAMEHFGMACDKASSLGCKNYTIIKKILTELKGVKVFVLRIVIDTGDDLR